MQKLYKAEGTLFPRVHLSLIGFNHSGYRKYGGIGFCIEEPSIKFQVEESKKIEINIYYNSKKLNYKNVALENILSEFCQKQGFPSKYSFDFFLGCPLHSGFGTGTNISLACIESICKINAFEYNQELLVNISNRGRTSGIGIQTYFTGGFVMDIGVKNMDNVFLPSSSNFSTLISKPLTLKKFPNWEFVVCIPKAINSLSKEEEIKFFSEFTPLSDEDVYEILYVSLFGISVAVIENDFDVFCESINRLQFTKWKKLERLNYKSKIGEMEKKIFQAGAKAVAMSSLGPSLIAFSEDVDSLLLNLEKISDEFFFIKTKSNNSGRIIYA